MRVTLGIVLGLLWLGLVGCSGTTAEPSPTPPSSYFVFSREGGIAGFCDMIQVRPGEVLYESCAGAQRSAPLEPALEDELRELQARYAPFEARWEDNPGGADSLVQQLQLVGMGSAEADEAVKARLLAIATQLLADFP